MKGKISFPLLLLVLALTISVYAVADGPNGTDPRPFYVIAHNPNTLTDVDLAIKCDDPATDPCANALEPDIIILPQPAYDLSLHRDPSGLVVYHDAVNLTSRVPATLQEYVQGIHDRALTHPQLALVMFDIKPEAAHPEYVKEIYDAVHNILNVNGVNLNVIYSVADISEISAFDEIMPLLGEREGVQVDENDDAKVVVDSLLNEYHKVGRDMGQNISYGDGTLILQPALARALDKASYLRATTGFPNLVGSAYTIKFEDSMNFYMDAGTDGIIPDLPDPLHPEFADGITEVYISHLQDVLKTRPDLRLATREDNPFQPKNQAYGVEVTTLNVDNGGTDAPLDFTLEGCNGTATVTVHTGEGPQATETNRMEKDGTDHVTIPALNLGKLSKLHIHNQGGDFNAPDWALGTVKVGSINYLGTQFFDQPKEYNAIWNKFINHDDTAHIDLTPNFGEPTTEITCPDNITVDNAPGQCSAIVSFAAQPTSVCNDLTSSTTPASGTSFDVGMTTVTAMANSAYTGNASCSFQVTVKDAEAPLISCPGPQVVPATGPNGATVLFAASAADNCSVTSVTSTPASGSLFAIGDTIVTSVAQDAGSNQSSCSFNVHVKGAAEQITDLLTYMNGVTVDPTNKNALYVKLQQALAKLSDANGGPVCGPLKSFINQVTALSGKSLSVADANYLITQANQIRTVVGCP